MSERGGATWSYDLFPWGFAALVALFSLFEENRSFGAQFWFVSALLLGLPHGACDHLVMARLLGHGIKARYIMSFGSIYLGAAGTMFLVWLLAPTAALAAFLALTAWHWGSADAQLYKDRSGDFVLRSTSRGTLLVSSPITLYPEETMDAFSSLLEVTGSARYGASWTSQLAPHAFIASLLLCCLLVARDVKRGRPRKAAREAIEDCIILALFLCSSPVAATGAYFLFWHSWRHVLRVDRFICGKRGGLSRRLVSYHLRALPMTAVSLTGLALMALVLGGSDTEALLSAYLMLLSCLTLPHAALVLFWDAKNERWG
ncbi:hypothetical protein Rxyl_2039 [Rubrobacter xylanophilus DSM 9941]|uniref:Probable beta-carotene 15,15'-dioxygenase n=1 Tax=Rubrobacter xylanophilus (strain DSM 9941 / JCM 11954 / NBRC 16129 / PRD-1) TaxID=266117 RepID=Q1AUE4_RUBXD|nr:Brp/Blh family beta-carotene 15,15'-dioxygenase [Rubrobacter xylanophilus]ABG04984.1 hypothetical protein Rxyl_2039 [Rubrobacter xylanophilus DSM 9941]